MNDTLIANDIKEAASEFLTVTVKPSVAAQALAEVCAEFAEKMHNFPGARDFWNKITKAFGIVHLTAFLAEKEFAKKLK